MFERRFQPRARETSCTFLRSDAVIWQTAGTSVGVCRRAEGREEGVGVLHQFLITGHTGDVWDTSWFSVKTIRGIKAGALIGGDARRTRRAGQPDALRRHAHLSDLDVRLVDGLRVQADDVLHVDDVALFDVLEFLRGRKKGN